MVRNVPRQPALLATFLAGLLGIPGYSQTPATAVQRPGRADYRIEVRLDEAARGLSGKLEVQWTNHTDRATNEAWFHLYWNAFANDRSTHLRESSGRLRGQDFDEEWGWQRVTSVRCAGTELMPSFRYRQPDDGNLDDRTVFSVELPSAVPPGSKVQIDLEWTAAIPRVRRRTGYKDDFLFIAQWFPKLGVFEGERGWNCHQFHASTEFYSNYGTYDVLLDLPVRFHNKIGASGVQVPPQEVRGDRVRATFLAPSFRDRQEHDARGRPLLVHDFAWTADPRYKIRRKTFQYDLWARRFDHEVEAARRALGSRAELPLRSVSVELLLHPEREKQLERHFEATSAALFFYGLWFGGYPYEQITVVDPAWGAGGAGGMEYPTLFTAGTRLLTKPDMHTPESVTVHECGHQFWYGLVGSNEFESSWMDEGFNSFTDSEVIARVWGSRRATTNYSGIAWNGVSPSPPPGGGAWAETLSARRIDLGRFELRPLPPSGWLELWRDQPWLTNESRFEDPRLGDRARFLTDPGRDPLDMPAWKYVDSTSYRVNSYQRPALILRTLRGLVGEEAFLRGMRHYADQWRFAHPRPDDFFLAFTEGSAADVSWFFDQAFRSPATLDWSVTVEQERRRPARGLLQQAPGAEFLPPAGAASAASAPDPSTPPPPAPNERQPWLTRVLVSRKGELLLPLTIELRWADGRSERRTWTREEQRNSTWIRIELEGNPRLTAVILDPDRVCWLDVDESNNRWFDAVDRVAPRRWTERVFVRWLHLLHWQAGLGG